MWKKSYLLIIILTTLGCGALRAQHYIGVRGGWGGGSARFTPSKETGTEWGLYSGGISYKFFTAQKFVGGVQADLQYLQRGFMYDLRSNGDSSYHRTINALELPMMWQPHFYFMQRHARFFVNLGIYLSYYMNSKYYYKSKLNGIYEQGPYTMKLTRDTRWGYGLCGGAGISILVNRFEVAFEGRYYFGYSDVLRNGTKYQGNPTHSPLDNINVSLAFYYRLGKEGIRAAPSKGVALKMQEGEAKRAARMLEKMQKRRDSVDVEITVPPDSLANELLQTLPDSVKQQKPKKEKTEKKKRTDAAPESAEPVKPAESSAAQQQSAADETAADKAVQTQEPQKTDKQ